MKKLTVNLVALLIFTMAFVVVSNGQTNDNSNAPKKQPDGQQSKDKPMKIIRKTFPQAGNCSEYSGVVTVRVTFDKSATVTKAEVVKSSDCVGFDKNALEAARGIKFTPATKDGEPITTTKLMQYSFRKS